MPGDTRHLNPSLMELTVFIETINQGGRKDAATVLGLRPDTVKSHLSNLYRRLGVTGDTAQRQALRILWPIVDRALMPWIRRDRRRGPRDRRAAA